MPAHQVSDRGPIRVGRHGPGPGLSGHTRSADDEEVELGVVVVGGASLVLHPETLTDASGRMVVGVDDSDDPLQPGLEAEIDDGTGSLGHVSPAAVSDVLAPTDLDVVDLTALGGTDALEEHRTYRRPVAEARAPPTPVGPLDGQEAVDDLVRAGKVVEGSRGDEPDEVWVLVQLENELRVIMRELAKDESCSLQLSHVA